MYILDRINRTLIRITHNYWHQWEHNHTNSVLNMSKEEIEKVMLSNKEDK